MAHTKLHRIIQKVDKLFFKERREALTMTGKKTKSISPKQKDVIQRKTAKRIKFKPIKIKTTPKQKDIAQAIKKVQKFKQTVVKQTVVKQKQLTPQQTTNIEAKAKKFKQTAVKQKGFTPAQIKAIEAQVKKAEHKRFLKKIAVTKKTFR